MGTSSRSFIRVDFLLRLFTWLETGKTVRQRVLAFRYFDELEEMFVNDHRLTRLSFSVDPQAHRKNPVVVQRNTTPTAVVIRDQYQKTR